MSDFKKIPNPLTTDMGKNFKNSWTVDTKVNSPQILNSNIEFVSANDKLAGEIAEYHSEAMEMLKAIKLNTDTIPEIAKQVAVNYEEIERITELLKDINEIQNATSEKEAKGKLHKVLDKIMTGVEHTQSIIWLISIANSALIFATEHFAEIQKIGELISK